MNRSINTLATPLINRTEQRTELNATPKLKANLCVWTDEMTSRKDTLGSVQEKEPAIEKTSSLEIHLSLDAENEGEKKWNIDARSLSFTSPTKEHKEKEETGTSGKKQVLKTPPITPEKLKRRSKKRKRCTVFSSKQIRSTTSRCQPSYY